MKPILRTPNNIDRQAESLARMTDFTNVDDEVEAVQDNSGDINIIAAAAFQTGMLPKLQLEPLIDFDVSDIDDYGSVLRKIGEANAAFMRLPPEVREKFDNDPKKAQASLSAMSQKDIEALIRGESKTATSGLPNTQQPGTGSAAAPAADPNLATGTPGGTPPGTPKPNPGP